MSRSTTVAKIGSREEWLAAREQLLAREKEHTRLGDEIAGQRRELPLVPVEKDYRFVTESPGFSTFVHDEDAVYHAYSTTWRGLEFLMGYYPILDHAPKGRDEGEAWQLWLRRHDEYGSSMFGS